MNAYTPLQTLTKVHRELWFTIRLVQSAQVQYSENLGNYDDCVEVVKVLRATIVQVERMIGRDKANGRNSLKLRQAEEFALKAQIAKAGGEAPAHRQLCGDRPSHK